MTLQTLLKALALSASTLALPQALAVDLVNKDSRRYEIEIEEGASTQRSSIGASTTQGGVCVKCRIVVVGVGALDVEGSVTLVIDDGRLRIQ
ncbi:hypothetical protein [Inhella sp.]|uniref:hypothetical protein n=1 Tax=Inhella sp. TaxID=1921806 RepID=UPI0035B0483D